MGRNSDERREDLAVIALGGNTLLGEHGPWTIDEQRAVIQTTARSIVTAIHAGYKVVLTHGNGPQVGNLLLQQENTPETPQLPLDVLVAETQAQIGYLLQQALDNELSGSTDFITVVTQAVVDPADPAFENPTKPIGPFYTEAEAAEKPFETQQISSGDRPYRRVVPSPEPIEIVESEEIDRLVTRGDLVICVGGGGVPVIREKGLRGVEAVIDKDKATQLLASELEASHLVILTDVEYAYVDFEGPDQQPLCEVTPAELRSHLRNGEFGTGSMQPKVDACLRFIDEGGKLASISSPDHLTAALEGDAGTRMIA